MRCAACRCGAFAASWLSIGAAAVERSKREVEKAGHEATMELLARTGGRL